MFNYIAISALGRQDILRTHYNIHSSIREIMYNHTTAQHNNKDIEPLYIDPKRPGVVV